jgi:hypothetical protein
MTLCIVGFDDLVTSFVANCYQLERPLPGGTVSH